jgi:hypothetical protein
VEVNIAPEELESMDMDKIKAKYQEAQEAEKQSGETEDVSELIAEQQCARMHTRTHTRVHTRTHTSVHTRTRAPTHPRTRAHTHPHTHARIRRRKKRKAEAQKKQKDSNKKYKDFKF